MKSIRKIIIFASIALCAMLAVHTANAQTRRGTSTMGTTGRNGGKTEKDSTKVIPRGLTTWTIDERFGTIIPTIPDTVAHLFQNDNATEGRYGEYNTTGNLGAPRTPRLYNGNQDYAMASQFVFDKPYSFVLNSVRDCAFTNTKSPITNLSYMTQGNKTNGDDRLRVLFATNAGKRTGLGFKVDYLYGRGYFSQQQQSSIASKIFASHRGEKYQMHTYYLLDRTKNAENGGLEDDLYITHPEYFSTKYKPADMPVRLQAAFNRLKLNTLFLTHRYNIGFYRHTDSQGNSIAKTAEVKVDSLTADTMLVAKAKDEMADSIIVSTFVPVAAFIHTMQVDHNRRYYIDNRATSDFYLHDFYGDAADSIYDPTRYISVRNTLAIEMSEGFKKWVKTGMRLYATHEYASFSLPDKARRMQTEHYNYITLGAQLMREQGRLFHYNVLGELRTTGADWGEFNVEGNLSFNIPIRKDSLNILARGFVRNETPAYYYRHFHSATAWWDVDLSKTFRTRIEGELRWRKTRLTVGAETIQNFTFWQQIQQMGITAADEGETPAATSKTLYGVCPAQAEKNVQLLQVGLQQDFTFGPLNWENRLTLQKSSDDKVLPLPLFNGWSNLYLLFRIAKVLRTEIGADVRYFTRYYAPAYVPMIGGYAVQDAEHRQQLGNYPWVNIYANFHLKHCRFYVMMGHVNCGNGNYFMTPHYPTNQRVLRFGISWNFFN